MQRIPSAAGRPFWKDNAALMTATSWKIRLATVASMAVLWAFFFNARLFPISLANEAYDALTPLTLYVVYGLSLVAAAGLAVFLESQPKASSYRRTCAGAGCLLGLGGALLVISPYGDMAAAPLFVGVGTGLLAAFLVAQFWYWTCALRERDHGEALVDAAVGLAIFCAASAPAALVHAASPVAFTLLPLMSLAGTLIHGKAEGASPSAPSEDSESALSHRLIRRLLIPSVAYFYLIQAMNVGLDFIALLPIADFRPWVFAFAVMGVAAVVLLILRPSISLVRQMADAFNVVSAFLLVALFVTCCQTMGLLPVGNYAIIAAKIVLCFFIWALLVLRPTDQMPARAVVLLALFLLLILWLPNLIQSIVLASTSATERPEELSQLFIILAGIALAVSVVSNVVISSLMPKHDGSASFANSPFAPREQTATSLPTIVQAPEATKDTMHEGGESDALALFQERYGLSDREAEIVRLAVAGKTAKRIASELFIAESTAYTHLKHIYRKAGVHSKQELVDLAETFR